MTLDLEVQHVGTWRLRVLFCRSLHGSCESKVKKEIWSRFIGEERGGGRGKDGESNFFGYSLFQLPTGLVLSVFQFCEISLCSFLPKADLNGFSVRYVQLCPKTYGNTDWKVVPRQGVLQWQGCLSCFL